MRGWYPECTSPGSKVYYNLQAEYGGWVICRPLSALHRSRIGLFRILSVLRSFQVQLVLQTEEDLRHGTGPESEGRDTRLELDPSKHRLQLCYIREIRILTRLRLGQISAVHSVPFSDRVRPSTAGINV